MRKTWSEVTQKDGTLFAPDDPFQLCSLYKKYAPGMSSIEQGLQATVKYETAEEQREQQFSTQKLVAHIVKIL